MKNNIIEGERPRNIGKKVRRLIVPVSAAITLAVALIATASCTEGVKTENIDLRTPTSGAATGTIPPTETPEQAFARGIAAQQTKDVADKKIADDAVAAYKATEQQPTPKTIIVQGPTVYAPSPETPVPAPGYDVYTPRPESGYGDFFSVRFNQNTGHYDLIDVRTKWTVDMENLKSQPISNQETGKGNTLSIYYYLDPGEAALVQGFTVNGLSNGFYGLRINESNNRQWFTDKITDGSVKKVPIGNAAASYASALNTAVDNSWAHGNPAGAMGTGN